MITRFEELALKYRCEYCVAGPGVWCRTITGAKATGLHGARMDPIMLSYSDGYLDASKSAPTFTYQTNVPGTQPNTSSSGAA